MRVKNYLEDMVREELNRLLAERNDVCKCKNCYKDMVTHTLNRLPTKYAISDLGTVVTKFHLTKDQLRAQVTVEILDAIETVKKTPYHKKKKK